MSANTHTPKIAAAVVLVIALLLLVFRTPPQPTRVPNRIADRHLVKEQGGGDRANEGRSQASQSSRPAAESALAGDPSAVIGDAQRAPVLFDSAPTGQRGAANSPRALTPDDVLREMRRAYQRLTSYHDRGNQSRIGVPNGLIYDHAFTTLFKRNAGYRFEWLSAQDPWNGRIWSDGRTAHYLDLQGNIRSAETLAQACRAIGTFEGTGAHAVLRLMDEQAAPKYPDLILPSGFAPNEIIDGVDCYHIAGVFPVNGWYREVWISTTDFLLRKIITRLPATYSSTVKIKNTHDEVIVTFHDVVTDDELADDLFGGR